MIRHSYHFLSNALRNVFNKYVANTPERWDTMYRSGYADKLQSAQQKARHYLICGLIAEYVSEGTEVLDVGCGVGSTYGLISQFDITYHGIDIAKQAIEIATATNNATKAHFEVNDFKHFAPSKKYDIVFFNEVLYYFSDTEIISALTKANSLLKDHNSVIIISMSDNPRSKRIWRSFSHLSNPEQEIYVRSGFWGKWNVKVFRPYTVWTAPQRATEKSDFVLHTAGKH